MYGGSYVRFLSFIGKLKKFWRRRRKCWRHDKELDIHFNLLWCCCKSISWTDAEPCIHSLPSSYPCRLLQNNNMEILIQSVPQFKLLKLLLIVRKGCLNDLLFQSMIAFKAARPSCQVINGIISWLKHLPFSPQLWYLLAAGAFFTTEGAKFLVFLVENVDVFVPSLWLFAWMNPPYLVHDLLGDVLQESRAHLEHEQHDDGQPVEHVVHRGRGERAAEALAVASLEGRRARRRQGCQVIL